MPANRKSQDEALVYPDYTQNTVANVPATAAALLSASIGGASALRPELWRPLLRAGEVRRVVLVLIDALGHRLLQRAGDEAAWVTQMAAVQGKITSVFPSTTVAALSALWTGYTPAQHGLVGLRLFLPRYATMGQMLSFSPEFISRSVSLEDAGLEPEAFLPVPGLGQMLGEAGVSTYALKHYRLLGSALSKMHGRGLSRSIGIVSPADMFWHIKELLLHSAEERIFVSAYWPAVDTLSHIYGPYHETVVAELSTFLWRLRQALWEDLPARARRGTVLLVTGDHGQIATPLEKRVYLEDHPELQEMLLMPPAGEPRTAYFYARQGSKQELLAYCAERLSNEAHAADAARALEEGWFGLKPFDSQTASRLGDVVVTMRDGYALLSRDDPHFVRQMVGRHGGMSAAEMEVPWLAFRPDLE